MILADMNRFTQTLHLFISEYSRTTAFLCSCLQNFGPLTTIRFLANDRPLISSKVSQHFELYPPS